MTIQSFLSYLYPQTVVQVSSPYNRLIRINLESGEYKLLVNGSSQSGRYIRALWQFALGRLLLGDVSRVKRIAVFGIGGGTVMHLLHALYPKAAMTGIDIDPVIVKLGRRYFGLDALPLTIRIADASRFVNMNKQDRYDLVILDLFVGPDIPAFVEEETFLGQVKQMLTPKGAILINYLREEAFTTRVNNLEQTLHILFRRVTSLDRHNNRFFLAR